MLMAVVAVTLCLAASVFAGNDLGARHEMPTGELQKKAQALADLAVKEGMQGALQFCAFKDGKCIVDVWAGTMTTNAGAAKRLGGLTPTPARSHPGGSGVSPRHLLGLTPKACEVSNLSSHKGIGVELSSARAWSAPFSI